MAPLEHPNIQAARIIKDGLDGISQELAEANFHNEEMKHYHKRYLETTIELREEQYITHSSRLSKQTKL